MSLDAVSNKNISNETLAPVNEPEESKITKAALNVLPILGAILLATSGACFAFNLIVPGVSFLVMGIAAFIFGFTTTVNNHIETQPGTLSERLLAKIQEIPKVPELNAWDSEDRFLGASMGSMVGDSFGCAAEFNELPLPQAGLNGRFSEVTARMTMILRSIDRHKINPDLSLRDLMDVQMVEFHHSEQPNPTDTLAHAVAQNYRGPEPRGITVEMQRENALADPGKSMITFKSIVASSAAIGVVYHENLTDVVEKTLSFAKDDVDDPKTLSAAVALSVAVALFLQGHNSIETVAQYSLSIATQVLKEEVVEDDQYESFANGLKASIENREIIPAARPNRFDPYKCLSDAFAALRLFEGADETQNRFRDIIQKVVKDPESLYPADVRANGAAAAALMGAYFGGRDFLDCYGDISREIRAIHHENFCLMGRLSGKYPNAG